MVFTCQPRYQSRPAQYQSYDLSSIQFDGAGGWWRTAQSLGSLTDQSGALCSPAKCELSDRTFGVDFLAGHFRKQVDVAGSDCASGETEIGRSKIQRLQYYA